MCDTKYQGWTNRATWSVSLWLNNEYGVYTHFCERVEELTKYANEVDQVIDSYWSESGYWSESQAVAFALADEIEAFVKECNPLAEDASMYSDILNYAIAGVDWEEVARSFIEK